MVRYGRLHRAGDRCARSPRRERELPPLLLFPIVGLSSSLASLLAEEREKEAAATKRMRGLGEEAGIGGGRGKEEAGVPNIVYV